MFFLVFFFFFLNYNRLHSSSDLSNRITFKEEEKREKKKIENVGWRRWEEYGGGDVEDGGFRGNGRSGRNRVSSFFFFSLVQLILWCCVGVDVGVGCFFFFFCCCLGWMDG